MEKNNGQMDLHSWDISYMAKNMVKEFLNGIMRMFLLGNLNIIKCMDKANINGKLVKNLLVNG